MMDYAVYIIDDDPFVRDGLSMVLKKEYRIKALATAEDGVAAVDNDPPDIVFLDIGLPGMSGIEALELIKKAILK